MERLRASNFVLPPRIANPAHAQAHRQPAVPAVPATVPHTPSARRAHGSQAPRTPQRSTVGSSSLSSSSSSLTAAVATVQASRMATFPHLVRAHQTGTSMGRMSPFSQDRKGPEAAEGRLAGGPGAVSAMIYQTHRVLGGSRRCGHGRGGGRWAGGQEGTGGRRAIFVSCACS